MSGAAAKSTEEEMTTISSGWSGLLETARRFGTYSWVEDQMFRTLGRWAADESGETGAGLAVMFDSHSRRHSWHSSLWFDRLPELSNVDAESLVAPPTPETVELFAEMGELTESVERLAAGYDVLVRHLVVAYRRELRVLDEIGDASTRHWLGFILANLTDELLESATELQARIATPDDVDQVAAVCSRFAKALLAQS